MMRTPRFMFYIETSIAALLLLGACGTTASSSAPTPQPTAIVQPTAVAASPTVAVPPTAVATAVLAPDSAALEAAVAAQIPAGTLQDTSFAEAGVHVLELQVAANQPPLWAAFSTGAASGATQHFVALYTYGEKGWSELARAELPNSTIVQADSVTQATITPDQLWLGVRSDSGLVGPCCYDLFRFDGGALHNELSFQERNVETVTVQKAQDGAPEVAIVVQPWGGAGATSVPAKTTTVFRWDGQHFAQR